MYEINTYDIETFTENDIVYPYCICAIVDNNEIIVYYEKNIDIIMKSIREICSKIKNDNIFIYIHNINFDGSLIINSLSKNNIFFDLLIKDLNIFSISFEYLNINFVLKCSYKIIPMSLKNLSFSEFKKKTFPYKFIKKENLNYIGECPEEIFFESPNDYHFFKNNIFDFKKESIIYCLNDVYTLKSILIDFLKTLLKLNNKYLFYIKKSYSIPSFSNKIFYKFFNNFNIEKKISLEMNSYISESYFGGRCEIFGNIYEDEIIHYFDYSGMYGQCMLQKFPIGKPNFNMNIKKIELPGFYYIKFTSNTDIPILPYKSKKLLFPNGELEGLYWYEEILEFVENGGVIKEYVYSITYEKEDYVFKDFVKSFTAIRELGGYYKIVGKLIINSLYGSFGMKIEEDFCVITFSEQEFNDILESTNVKNYFKVNNCYIIKILKDYKSKKIYNKNNKRWDDFYHERNVAYSSIISSKARIKLYRAMMSVLNDNGRLLYCDTDSIFAAYKKNNLNKKCGDDIIWSEKYEDGLFILPKTYILKNNEKEIIKFKGVDNSDISFNILKSDIKRDYIKFQNQMTFFKKNMILKQKYIEKNIFLKKYDKRILSKNMKESKPIYLTHTLIDGIHNNRKRN